MYVIPHTTHMTIRGPEVLKRLPKLVGAAIPKSLRAGMNIAKTGVTVAKNVKNAAKPKLNALKGAIASAPKKIAKGTGRAFEALKTRRRER